MTYMLTEFEDASAGEVFYALGTRYVKQQDGGTLGDTIVRWITGAPPPLTAAAGLRQLWDAAWPPSDPPNAEGVAGYIGGGTPHVWTDAEWAASLSKSTAQLRLPIFVRVPPTTRDPVVEANFSADWAEAHGQPKGTLIALDYETAIDPWQERFDAQIVRRGYKTVLYGSRSFVMQNKSPSGGFWTATWNNIPHVDDGAVMTQYGGDVTLGQPWDINVALNSVPFWDITGGDMPLTTADSPIIEAAVRKVLRVSTDNMTIIQDGQANNDHAFSILAARLATAVSLLTSLRALVQSEGDQTQAAIAALNLSGADAATIAAAVIAGLGPELAAAVATELSTRLSS